MKYGEPVSQGSIGEFIEARYAEREAAIERLRTARYDLDGDTLDVIAVGPFLDVDDLLADIASKRKILEVYRDAVKELREATEGPELPGMDPDEREAWLHGLGTAVEALESVVHLLAAPLSGHPGFDPEWKVDG